MAKSTSSINARQKGHSYERLLANKYSKLFGNVLTSRNASKILDDCKIDLYGDLPFRVQAKSGYADKCFNYNKLLSLSNTLLDKNMSIEDAKKWRLKPFIIHHKPGRPLVETVTIPVDLFFKLLECKYTAKE